MQVRDVRVTAFPTCHLEDFRRSFGRRYPVGFEAYSFLLEGGGLRIGHTADIGHVADLEPLVAKPLDHLVCELSHCEPAAICEALRGRRIGRISFVHLARELWADRRGTQRLLRANLGNIPFTLVRDGETVAL